MPLTVLFDLDETLLATNMRQFLPRYFEFLSQAFSHLGSHDQIVQQTNFAVGKMLANQDPGKTLQEVFAENFYPQLGTTEQACQSLIESFYRHEYPHLKPITQFIPEASQLVAWCQATGMTMAIATNPLFPAIATRQRIDWAGLDPEDFYFYTSYNDFHFTKPHLAYYAEVLGRLGWPEHPIVMIGDNLTDDLSPMDTFGAETFWVHHGQDHAAREGGTLSEVKPWLQQMMQSNWRGLNWHPEVNTAILHSTPAVIDTWLRAAHNTTGAANHQPEVDQIKTMLGRLIVLEEEVYPTQFDRVPTGSQFEVPEPDASRNLNTNSEIQEQNMQEIFVRFLTARENSLEQIKGLIEEGQANPVKQIAQPITNLIAWMAEQDRKHLRHCVNL